MSKFSTFLGDPGPGNLRCHIVSSPSVSACNSKSFSWDKHVHDPLISKSMISHATAFLKAVACKNLNVSDVHGPLISKSMISYVTAFGAILRI